MTSTLTSGSVAGNLRKQATPFAWALVAIFSFEAVDLFFISRLGDAPLAAVAFTFPVIWLVYGIFIGFEAGAASCVSRAVGRSDDKMARRLTTDTAVLAAIVALLITFLGLVSIKPVFALLGATDNLMPLVTDYMNIWYWVVPADSALWTSLAAIRARGNTLLESKIIIAAALLNLVLDPIFIFGLFGFPELGMRGAALATVLATFTMLIFTIYYLNFRLHVYANVIAPVREIFASWTHMLKIGIPAIATNAIIPISNGIVVALIAGFGVDAVAGFGIAMRVEPVVLIPFYALSAVASPFTGQNLGSELFDRLLEARRVITRFCLGFGLALAALISLAAIPIAGIFRESTSIKEVAVHYIWIVSGGYGAYGMVMSINASFNGLGVPIPGLIITTARVLVVFLPLALLGKYLFGLHGLFAASTISNLLLGAIGWAWLGRQIRIMSARSAQPNPG
jgi:putative MATE family efflux protein